jgi:ribose/xylose/arabinose/galactoside ABC-type transport system permease subunit
MAGLTAIFDLARFHVTDIQGHNLDNLNAIAAVVIGGNLCSTQGSADPGS